ncbi:putative phosphatidylglycerol/phosphatidylinositol transfer protein 2 [Haliotis asinina]|uniref:putative phosphatidylglycerol/phosphatidylinositol transfer protein 2 n=1 Tax=Haliotis asinina TaxID=109174 RepID=UPI00353226A0
MDKGIWSSDSTGQTWPSRMAGRRCICYFSAILFVTCIMGIYYTYFKRPPLEELMRMNSKRTFSNRAPSIRNETVFNVNEDDLIDGEVDTSAARWESFVRRNNFVSVGEVWDRGCDDKGRKTIGTVIMMPDKETGGLKTRTFVNYTLHEDVEEGEFYLDVKYNNNDLFDNHWDLCTLEEESDQDKRTIFCPIKRGQKNEIKDREIPIYLPKGKYYTRSWITNQNGVVLMCGYSDFVL